MILILTLFVAALVYALSKAAPRVGLLAYPGEHRTHQEPTPMVGGIAIYLGILVWVLTLGDPYLGLIPGLTVIVIVGVIDDRFHLPSWLRFIAQGLAAYLVIMFTDTELLSLGKLVSDEPFLLGNWSIPLTIFAVVGVINALNMSDGLDGLAGSLTLLVVVGLILLGGPDRDLAMAMMATVLGFLFWNIRVLRPQARVFMGDAGSTMLGLLLGFLLIRASQTESVVFEPVTALWFLVVPLIDAVAVLFLRPLRGMSPFAADQIHYHHLLLAKGLSVNQTLLASLAVHAMFIVAGMLFLHYNVPETVQFYMFLGVFVSYLIVATRQHSR